MTFNLLKIIHSLQGKKHLRTFSFKYIFFSVITQLNVTVTVVLYLKAYYIHIETKEENSGNIFLITINENLYFKI